MQEWDERRFRRNSKVEHDSTLSMAVTEVAINGGVGGLSSVMTALAAVVVGILYLRRRRRSRSMTARAAYPP